MTQNLENLSYEERIAQVRKRFIHTLAERLGDIADAIQLAPETCTDETQAHKLHRMLHDMGGNAAMLEFDEIEKIIRQGVDIAEQADVDGRELTQDQKTRLAAIVDDAIAAGALLKEQY